MDRKERIEQEVMKTFQCLDQIERIEGSPFFYARLQAKIRNLEDKQEHSILKIFSANMLRPAFLTLVVVLNLVASILVFQESGYQFQNREEYVSAFASEYDLNEKSSDLQNPNQ